MKIIFGSLNSAETGLLKTVLENAGIQTIVRNETQWAPGLEFTPEVWIVNDADYEQAMEVRDSWLRTPVELKLPWTCQSCGELIEGQFTSCWKCGAERNPAP
ncbi:MAG TPA: DUF2007 domain-containing protein [Verrucomicrobiae bacterium]|jgi:hypothetical protein